MPNTEIRKSENFVPHPVFRRLRGYAFDPSLSLQLDTALLNEAVFKVCWEEKLEPGPVGEYLEIVDYDPASKSFYAPVDLNHPHILAQDGLSPSEGSPQFHQQMVYAVAMTTIENFEKALGREALWSSYREEIVPTKDGKGTKTIYHDDYIRRLRIYPHALRQANAYYSCDKKALLFGYFPAVGNSPGDFLPNGLVFTCLSHDIIAHETTHALLDGMHRRFIEPSHRDTLAFHEAFADIVALFQHFSFPEVLKHQIAKTRGRLDSQNLLGQLAQQFGKAIGQYGALRDAIGEYDKEKKQWNPKEPNPGDYQTINEPHARGAILVAAIFDTFLAIYKCRIADLLRIYTGGTGVLPDGELHPDLVNRLADEAARTARQILNMCIRALDYCPPVDISFGDYLRALITADIDLVPDDDLGYRIALIDAFKRRGIYPRDIRTLSEESLCWKKFEKEDTEQLGVFKEIAQQLRDFVHHLEYLDELPPNIFDRFNRHFSKFMKGSQSDIETRWKKEMSEREKIYVLTEAAKSALAEVLIEYKKFGNPNEIPEFEKTTGLYLLKTHKNENAVRGLKSAPGEDPNAPRKYTFEVHSLRAARRVGPDGNSLDQVIISITQKRTLPIDKNMDLEEFESLSKDEKKNVPQFKFRGGCTLILDLQDLKLRYVIPKTIGDKLDKNHKYAGPNERLKRQREFRFSSGGTAKSLRATYFGKAGGSDTEEPFALLHDRF
ncbi:hypothetical protein BH20ACI4_BH20ACI4_24880 [soil metagenome]